MQTNLIEIEKQLEAMSATNDQQSKTYRKIFDDAGHPMFETTCHIADSHEKEKSVITDARSQLKTLELNMKRWSDEYRLVFEKLKLRDATVARHKTAVDTAALNNNDPAYVMGA